MTPPESTAGDEMPDEKMRLTASQADKEAHDALPLVERLRHTPNWMRESYGSWKDCVLTYDRSPFEAADEIDRLRVEIADRQARALKAHEPAQPAEAAQPNTTRCAACDKPAVRAMVNGVWSFPTCPCGSQRFNMLIGAAPPSRYISLQERVEKLGPPWKQGNEFLPYHPSASHVSPDQRDGWNWCYLAALAAAPTAPQEARQPVAHVPVHPRNGPLWMDTYPHGTDVSQSRSGSYPTLSLYAAPPPTDAPALTEAHALSLVQRLMPHHPDVHSMTWTAIEARAIEAFGMALIRALRTASKPTGDKE
jgi:hypothetical protein